MNLEDLVERWEKDCEFSSDIGEDLKDIPLLHYKYFKLLVSVKRKLNSSKEKYEEKKHVRTLFYSGRGSDDDYREEKFDHRLAKSEIPMWLAADKELKILRKEVEALTLFKESLDEILKQINNRHWYIKSMLDNKTIELGIRG